MYQDLWIKGRLIKEGKRECASRYQSIYQEINKRKIKRPFTVLDIGACYGYFSFRLAEDFGAQVTMIEANSEIVNYHKANEDERVRLLNQKFSTKDLFDLSRLEQYDVVLALSILHHFKDYQAAVKAIFSLGDIIFIEPPALEETRGGYKGHRAQGIHDLLMQRSPTILTSTDNLRNLGKRPLMVFDAKDWN